MSKENIVKLFNSFNSRHSAWDLFNDFIKMTSIAFSNKCDLMHLSEREAEYLEIVKGYSESDLILFANILAELSNTLQEDVSDILGELFMMLGLGSDKNGQFFTPYHISKATANIGLEGVEKILQEQSHVMVCEPACGGGAMIIAASEIIKEKGFNPQKVMLAECTDIDAKGVYMTYIQLSLLHIPAIVKHGNALTQEVFSEWYTPAYVVGNWAFKKPRGIKRYEIESEEDGQMRLVKED